MNAGSTTLDLMQLALTFDDGPGVTTLELLEVLERSGVKATFFLVGRHIEEHRHVALRALREGHLIGNHSYSHSNGREGWATFADEVTQVDAQIRDLHTEAGLRIPDPIPLRLPYGLQAGDREDEGRLSVVHRLGRRHLDWSSDFADWSPKTTADRIFGRLVEHCKGREAGSQSAVLDLHDAGLSSGERRDATLEAVKRFIPEAMGCGWAFVRADELDDLDRYLI